MPETDIPVIGSRHKNGQRSKFFEVFEKARLLEEGEGFEVSVPKDADPREFLSAMSSAFGKSKDRPVPPEGCVYRRQMTSRGTIAVILRRIEPEAEDGEQE